MIYPELFLEINYHCCLSGTVDHDRVPDYIFRDDNPSLRSHKIDSLDLQIIDILEKNCSLAYEEIARKTGKSMWTVRDRIDLLKKRDIIKECRAGIDYGKIGYSCRAVLAFNVPPEMIDELVQFSRHNPRIKRTIVTTGQRRFLMEIIGEDCSEIRNYARKEFPQFGIYDIDLEVILDEILP